MVGVPTSVFRYKNRVSGDAYKIHWSNTAATLTVPHVHAKELNRDTPHFFSFRGSMTPETFQPVIVYKEIDVAELKNPNVKAVKLYYRQNAALLTLPREFIFEYEIDPETLFKFQIISENPLEFSYSALTAEEEDELWKRNRGLLTPREQISEKIEKIRQSKLKKQND